MLFIIPAMESHTKSSPSLHDLNFSDHEGDDRRKRSSSTSKRGAAASPPSCQAEMCTAVLDEAKRYHRRHKVCEFHAKAAVVLVSGLRQRFCQQCSRFHEVSEFDDAKRSCRRRLAGHNERRRKASTSEAAGKQRSPEPGGDQMKESQCRAATDERDNSVSYKHFEIR